MAVRTTILGGTTTCLCFAISNAPNDSFYRLLHTPPIRTPKHKGYKIRLPIDCFYKVIEVVCCLVCAFLLSLSNPLDGTWS